MSRVVSEAKRLKALGLCAPRAARDPVNQPMINNWVEAIGGAHAEGVVPPAMVQVWTMRGLHPAPSAGDDPLHAMSAVLDEEGFTSVVATNCEQEYLRPLKVGELLTVRSRLSDVVGPKQTALGEGWFVTTESTWFSGSEPVATMMFRILKYRPKPVAPAGVIEPVLTRDTEFFWAGTARGELRIQRCSGCGRLRHPPGPMCPACGATAPDFVVAEGAGAVFSFVRHHHPAVPGRQTPFIVALVQLPEGVRVLGEFLGDEVEIGQAVRVTFVPAGEFFLPAWEVADGGGPRVDARRTDTSDLPAFGMPERGLPPLSLEVTPTFIVATALATRDFQDVHHDRDRAIARGSKDIFLNILTTTGLVQRYVADWAGPSAAVRSIVLRLGVPCYAYETLTFTGRVVSPGEVEVLGKNSLGTHVTATVRLA